MLSLELSEPGRGRDRAPDREVIAWDVDGVEAAYGWRSGSGICIEVPDVATFRTGRGCSTIRATPAPGVERSDVVAAYYDTALPFAVQATRDLEVVHGSAVCSAATGCVASFCGSTEAGKSTIAYGLRLRGHDHWADDSVAFRIAEDGLPVTVALPFKVNLREASSNHLGVSADGPDEQPTQSSDGRFARLGSIFMLEPVEPAAVAGSTFDRLEAATALQAVIPNAFRFLPATPERKRQTMAAYLELVASVPVWRVRYPRDISRLTELLDALEAHMALP